MKNYIVALVALMMLQFCIPARAAFIVRVPHADTTAIVKMPVAAARPVPEQRSGWAGILSLICGVLAIVMGIISFPMIFFLFAIIFGIVGVGKNRKHQLFAAIGIILGIIGGVLLLIN